MATTRIVIQLCVALTCISGQVAAGPLFDSELHSFTVLGSSTVTNVPESDINGDEYVVNAISASTKLNYNQEAVYSSGGGLVLAMKRRELPIKK